MKKLLLLLVLTIFSSGLSSQDTFSICAIDTITGEVGSAGASCVFVAGQGVRIISDVHPGVGVVHTQAWYLPANKVYAHTLMNQGVPPQQIIDSLVANDAENNPTLRQYGIVDFREGEVRSAAYTGVNTDNYKNHIVGPNYSIQGNILLGQEILDSIESRFLNAEGELVCRLMEALQGANVPGADARCLADGTSSIGAFLRVAKPDDETGNYYFDVNLPSVDEGVDPIDSLQVLVDLWGGCETTGLKNFKNDNLLKVYPNPANNKLTFEFNHAPEPETSIVLWNSYGSQICELTNLKARENIETHELPPGIYFYQLIGSEDIKKSGKIVIN